MVSPKTIINTVKRDTKKLSNQLRRDKNTFVSSDTLGLAVSLSQSINDDKILAKQMKEDLKKPNIWPFPKTY